VVREDEIGQVGRAFNQMTGRVEQMIKDRERLLADVSHELRSPLARIKVALEMLPDSDKRDAIARDIREMEALTTMLLEREQLRHKADNRESEHFDLVALTREIGDSFADRSPGVQISTSPSELDVLADAALIKVLIQNLIDNAVKFSLADSQAVELRLEQDDEGVRITVIDDGPGIPTEEIDHVFDAFVKLNPARGHRAGYGLGLNLCQRIAQAHGGRISLTPGEERGTQAQVILPDPET
jgi:signal transduction histidine kinase